MKKSTKYLAFGAAAATSVATLAATGVAAGAAPQRVRSEPPAKHVLLLSVDGMHQADLEWYVTQHPSSALAALVQHGTEFTNAQTPAPSDSFPGMVGQVTGGNPKTTGVYYDDSYNKALLPAGTTSCSGPSNSGLGAEVTYFEALDKDPHALDAGQGLTGLPNSILHMTGNPTTLIDPSQLPVDPATCQPVYPNNYLRVNTVFGVAHAAALHTAWSDKHPAYQILNGPGSTNNIDDLFAPEINSNSTQPSGDWTSDNLLTQQYDNYKVQAVLNEIAGHNHDGSGTPGTPAIFGMNFQTVSTAQKLLTSNTENSSTPLPGGYVDGGKTPGPVLANALDFINAEVGSMMTAIHQAGLDNTTTMILSAKHGQSPTNAADLQRIKDGPIITAINTAWGTTHANPSLVSFSVNDDGMLLWLSDSSAAAKQFVTDYLLNHTAPGTRYDGSVSPVAHSGLVSVADGPTYFGIPASDAVGMSRVPDLLGIAQVGTVYTGGSKIAEHGGVNPADRHVPLVVTSLGDNHPRTVTDAYETTSIAPTILSLLGLDPGSLQAVRAEHTPVLPLHGRQGQDGQGNQDSKD